MKAPLPHLTKRHLRMTVAIASLLFAILSLYAVSIKSLTADESAHLASGFVLWQTGRDHLNPEHPPLTKRIASFPLWLTLRKTDVTSVPGFLEGDRWTFAKALLYGSEAKANLDRYAFLGRSLAFILFALSLALVTFFFSYELWGAWGALFSLGLFIFCPNLLAHGPLIQNDIASALGVVLTTWMAYRFDTNPKRRHAVYLGIALGFALATNFSSVLFIPYVVGIFIHNASKDETTRNLQHFLWILLMAILVMSISYGGIFKIGDYMEGLLAAYSNQIGQDYPYFLAGRYNPDGFLFYYPIAIVLKTPLPSLLAIAASLYLTYKHERRILLLVGIAASLPLLAGALTRHNVGVRQVLATPILLYVLAGALTHHMPPRIRAWMPRLLAIVLAAVAFEGLRYYPSTLSYFNQLAGGPRGGIRYLDDSNVDWGLEQRRLPKHLERLGMSSVKLDAFGLEPFSFRDIRAQKMTVFDRYFPLGDCVVSAHWLQRKPLVPGVLDYSYDWLDRYVPISSVGYGLYIYRFRLGDRTEVRDGTLTFEKTEWLQNGIARLHLLLAKNPKFYHGLVALGEAYVLDNNASEARRALARAASFNTLDPEDPYRRSADHLEKNGFHKEATQVRSFLQLESDTGPTEEAPEPL